MTNIIKQFLELDNYINDNYLILSEEERQEKIKKLQELCEIIINN